MKFLLITLITLSSLVAKSATNEEPITPVVLESFQTTFGNNCNVSWTSGRYFYKAEFSFHGQFVSAFFTKTGNLLATSKNIVFAELPLSLQISFRGSYNGYWISDLFEMTKDGETTYYLTLENGDQKLVLQSSINNWNVYEKKNK